MRTARRLSRKWGRTRKTSFNGRELRNQLLEASMVQLPPIREWIASRPAHSCSPRLEVEAAIEIERRAILVELGAHAGAIGEDEVDLFGARQQAHANGADGDAFGPLCSIHRTGGRCGRGSTGMRRMISSWTTSRVTVCTAPGCAASKAEQHRDQAQERHRSH